MSLLKMTIFAFKSFDNPMDLIKPKIFVAMFNPASYKVDSFFAKDDKLIAGAEYNTNPVTSITPKKISFEFLIDGTGASGEQKNVLVEVMKFERLVKFESKVFETQKSFLTLNKLLLLWGTFIFTCEIETYSVNYTLFNQLGVPLRATIAATFTENTAGSKLNVFEQILDEELEEQFDILGSFGSASSLYNNASKSAEMARAENLDSLRGN